MIESKYREKAAVAADAMRAALLAVEACGADVELTNIVAHLGDDRSKLCQLFGLPPEQAFQVERLTPLGDVPRDWTCSTEGHSNSSDLFVELCDHVETLIRNDAHSLIGGRADMTARLIVAQLAHVHHLVPTEERSDG